ncbi:hypothetical protein NPIL_699941 [Nephila pilipes]|uniref:Uncharacterized protein n=1 Tax=Nephila pilipes TaxID=299642 RepID=A0A8X6JXJ2_NEPPI|nr:hypothetical protein NPIL_699941 [Nephila pilipes]
MLPRLAVLLDLFGRTGRQLGWLGLQRTLASPIGVRTVREHPLSIHCGGGGHGSKFHVPKQELGILDIGHGINSRRSVTHDFQHALVEKG